MALKAGEAQATALASAQLLGSVCVWAHVSMYLCVEARRCSMWVSSDGPYLLRQVQERVRWAWKDGSVAKMHAVHFKVLSASLWTEAAHRGWSDVSGLKHSLVWKKTHSRDS